MLIELEKRKEPSKAMLYLTPVIAVVATMLAGAIIFSLIGHDGLGAVRKIFLTPLLDTYKWQDLGVKAAPLNSQFATVLWRPVGSGSAKVTPPAPVQPPAVFWNV
jgi:hypothetical protein